MGEPSHEPQRNGLAYSWGNSASLRLEPGDILRVVEAYTAGEFKGLVGRPIGGSLPAILGLHPWVLAPELASPEWKAKYRAIRRELAADVEAVKAQGVEVIPVSGMLSWEIRLYPDAGRGLKPPTEDTFYNTPAQIEGQGAGPVVKSVVKTGGGVLPPHRPRAFDEAVDHRIEALMQEGLGARAIRRVLRMDGIEISLSTISKKLQQFRSWGNQ